MDKGWGKVRREKVAVQKGILIKKRAMKGGGS